MFSYKINTCFTLENLNFFLLLSHFLANIGTANIGNVLSMLFSQCWSNANEHKFTQLSFLTKYQHWNNIGSSTMNRRNSFNVVQHCFVNVETTSIKIRRLHFYFPPNFDVETTLVDWRWFDVILSTLFQRCLVNVETTSINASRLHFHVQPNFNVGTTLVHRRWFDVILSTLFQRCFVNVETTSINVRQLNLHFQC